MKNRLFLRFASRPIFWDLRRLAHRVFFFFSRAEFRLRQKAEFEVADSRAFRNIITLALPELLFSLGVAIAAQATNPLLGDLNTFLGWASPEDGIYGTLLGGVTSIGAIFIGLYYAALTAVGSAAYVRLPTSVRELLVRERIGNAYMRFLAFLTFFSLSLLVFRVLGYPRVALIIPLVLILSGIGIIGFVRLGQRAFYLFDPVAISDETFIRLSRLADQVSPRGFRWRDPSFQRYARQNAETCLDAIESLQDLCIRESHLSQEPQFALLQQLTWFLQKYTTSKRSIPTDSEWYARRQVYSSWYITSDSSVSIAHQTGTRLQPIIATNHRWIEERLEPLLVAAGVRYAAADQLEEARQTLTLVKNYATSLAQVGDIESAVDLLGNAGEQVFRAIENLQPPTTPRKTGEILSVADTLATAPIDLCIAYGANCEQVFHIALGLQPDAIAAPRGSVFYVAKAPVKVLERIEWARRRLTFEKRTEGKIVSPPWYVRELIAVVAAELHANNVRAINVRALRLYDTWVGLMRSKNRWAYATVLSRQWEYLHKLNHFNSQFQTTWQSLTIDRRVEELPWASLDFAAVAAERQAAKKTLLSNNAADILALADEIRPKFVPDYFGQFLHSVGEELFDALLEGDEGLLKSTFPIYFSGCLTTFDNLRKELSNETNADLRTLRIASGPILDLLALSGYAKVFASVHGKGELWSYVQATWETYLNEAMDPPRTRRLAALLGVISTPLTIPMRGVLRTSWDMRAKRRIDDIPSERYYHKESSFGASSTIVQHPDPLVRMFGGSDHNMISGQDVFIDLYLAERPDADDLTFSRPRGLKRRIERETELYERAKKQI